MDVPESRSVAPTTPATATAPETQGKTSPAAAAPAVPQAPPSTSVRRVMAQVAESLQRFLDENHRDLEFRVDAGADTTVITVRNADGELVRQIPNEEALRLMRQLNEGSATVLDVLA